MKGHIIIQTDDGIKELTSRGGKHAADLLGICSGECAMVERVLTTRVHHTWPLPSTHMDEYICEECTQSYIEACI